MNTSDEIIAGLTEKISNLHSAPANSATATSDEIIALKSNLDTMTSNWEYCRNEMNDLRRKIENVRGHIMDIYSMSGSLDDDIKEIAGYLDISLTKRISGTATYEISFSAEVPLDFDADDLELSFSVECESYEAESFTWDEEDTNVNAEDEF